MNKSLSVIIVLLLLGIGVMGVVYFAKQNNIGQNFATNESQETPEATVTDTSDTQLDEDLADIQLEDPTADFISVDSDINSL